MIIEVGKSYKMRNGETTEIVKRARDGLFTSDISYYYSNYPEGNFVQDSTRIHEYDLMEEI